MIAAIVMGSFGLVAALIGVQCSKAGGDNEVLKGRIAGTAGVLFILQGKQKYHFLKKHVLIDSFGQCEREFSTRLLSPGLCTMIAISWYAANITREFFDPFYPGTK